MKIRSAGLLDLSRIEEMHRSSDVKLSEAEPPAARLWSLLSSTLSALLPLAQDTLIYVAEEKGKVVGYIQASGQPLALDLRRARVLQVLNLQVADEVDADEVAPALVQHLCNQALERGAMRLFVRLPDRDALLPAFRLAGFRQYATEQVLYSEKPRQRSDEYPLGIRPTRRGDDRRLYQLYRKVTPQGVSQLEAPTFRDWRGLHAGDAATGSRSWASSACSVAAPRGPTPCSSWPSPSTPYRPSSPTMGSRSSETLRRRPGRACVTMIRT